MWLIQRKLTSERGRHKLSNMSREAIIISEVLADPIKRKMLVNELATTNEEDANLIRFYQSCREYRGIGKKKQDELSLAQISSERAGLGKKIISMFIEGGSVYEVTTLLGSIKTELLSATTFSPTTFDYARHYVGALLHNSDRIVRTAQKIGVIHSSVMEAIKIMATVEDDKRRRMLVNELVEENLEEAHELRFFQACKSYQEVKDPKKLFALGRKIISMFIEAGSPYELQNLNEITRLKLLDTKKFTPTTFETATEQVLHGLETSSSMVRAAKSIGIVESSILSGKSATSASAINAEVFERMVNNPLLADEFEKFVRDELIDELWKFRSDVNEWKFSYNELTEEQARGRAAEIYEFSVKPGSQYEINVSGEMKSRIEKTLNEAIGNNASCPLDIFDEALKEVSSVLLQNINYRVMSAVRASMNFKSSGSSGDLSVGSPSHSRNASLASNISSGSPSTRNKLTFSTSIAGSGKELLGRVLGKGGS